MAKKNNRVVILTPNEIQSLLEFCRDHLDSNVTIEQNSSSGIGPTTMVSVVEDNDVIITNITDYDSW